MQKKISVWRNGLEVKSSKPARITSSGFEAYAAAVMAADLFPPRRPTAESAVSLPCRSTEADPDPSR